MSKNKKQLKSAGLLIIYNNKFLLAHQRGRKKDEGYGIPKGLIDKKETILEAAIRETNEELGLTIPKELIDTSKLFKFEVNTYKYNKTVYYYNVLINNLKQIGLNTEIIPVSNLQIDEIDEARFMDITEALSKITKSQKNILNNNKYENN